jgi:outer membrane protein OmpA-like peptidoglycan-associated protein
VLLAAIDYTLEKMDEEDESLLAVDILGMYDSENQQGGTKIMLTNSDGEVIATTVTGDKGRFKFESVRPDERYTIKSENLEANSLVHIVNEKGDLITTIDPSGDGEHIYVRLDPSDGVITLTNEHNERVRISNKDLFDLGVVNYEYNSTDIGMEGVEVLARLADILEKNPAIYVELEGHTDSRGPDAYNLQLSQERIESAMDYLEIIGIERKRLSGTGYGELQPVNHCENGAECSEVEHAANRRTAFRLADGNE